MNNRTILLSADTPCDIGAELKDRYQVSLFPLHIILDGKDYRDGIDITPEEIYQKYYDEKSFQKLPPSMLRNILNILNHGSMKAMK